MKDEEKKEDEEIHNQTELMLQKIKEQMKITFETLQKPTNKKKVEEKQNQNLIKIPDSELEFVNLEQDYAQKPENAIFDDICSICSSKIYYIKYICVVCTNCTLCPKCEIEHVHPVLKCKNKQFSKLEHAYIYINTKNQELKNSKNSSGSGFLSSIFSNKFELKLDCNSYAFTMRKNSKINIPITITNLSSSEIDCGTNKIALFGRNNKDLKVYSVYLKEKINKSQQIETSITIESNKTEKEKKYDFTIEVFSLISNKLKSNILNFKVEINDDKDEDTLNEFFKDYPKIIIESKGIKEGVKKIYIDIKQKYDPMVILQYLKNNKGNVDDTFLELSKK
jgi:hypothetical protein